MKNFRLFFWISFFALISFFLFSVRSILTPFIASIIITYFLDPLTQKLENLGIKRGYTVSIIVAVFFLVIISFLFIIIPSLVDQVKDFILDIPRYQEYINKNIVEKVQIFFEKIDPRISTPINKNLSEISNKFFSYFITFSSKIFNSSLAFLNIVGLIFFTPILVFYLLKDWPTFTKKFNSLLPLNCKTLIMKQLKEIDSVISAYLRGQITVCVIFSIFYSITLSLIGLKFSLLLGIISGFFIIIPYLGFLISLIACSLVTVIQFPNLNFLYVTIAIFIIGNIVEGYFITPKLVGEKVGLHPVWLIFALMSGGCLFGLFGLFLAVPSAAIIGVITKTLIKFYLESNIYSSKQ